MKKGRTMKRNRKQMLGYLYLLTGTAAVLGLGIYFQPEQGVRAAADEKSVLSDRGGLKEYIKQETGITPTQEDKVVYEDDDFIMTESDWSDASEEEHEEIREAVEDYVRHKAENIGSEDNVTSGQQVKWNGDTVEFWEPEDEEWVTGTVVHIEKAEDGDYYLHGKKVQRIAERQYSMTQESRERDIREKADAMGISIQEMEKHAVLVETDAAVWFNSPQDPDPALPFGGFAPGNSDVAYVYLYRE